MGQSMKLTGTYLWGFVAFALVACAMLFMLRRAQIRWTRTWAERGGRARPAATPAPETHFGTASFGR
jgi:NNP family nitrate/nitrite transporter-like MFS transporter